MIRLPGGHHEPHGAETRGLSGPRFLGVTLLNALITVVEIAGGIVSGSLALLSDAAHNLGDTIAILTSYIAWRIAGRENDMRRTYGYKRAEIIAAFVNASALVAISLFLVFEAIRRFRNPETIHSGWMIGVALFGLAANFISMLLLKRAAHGNMNVRSSYLHLLGDTVSSVGVLGGGITIRIWGLLWIDPLVTILISVYIMRKSWVIVTNSVGILMQSAAELDYGAMQREIEATARSAEHPSRAHLDGQRGDGLFRGPSGDRGLPGCQRHAPSRNASKASCGRNMASPMLLCSLKPIAAGKKDFSRPAGPGIDAAKRRGG